MAEANGQTDAVTRGKVTEGKRISVRIIVIEGEGLSQLDADED